MRGSGCLHMCLDLGIPPILHTTLNSEPAFSDTARSLLRAQSQLLTWWLRLSHCSGMKGGKGCGSRRGGQLFGWPVKPRLFTPCPCMEVGGHLFGTHAQLSAKILPDPSETTVCRDKHQPQIQRGLGNGWRSKQPVRLLQWKRRHSKCDYTENSGRGKTKGSGKMLEMQTTVQKADHWQMGRLKGCGALSSMDRCRERSMEGDGATGWEIGGGGWGG